MIISVGAFLFAFGVLLFLIDIADKPEARRAGGQQSLGRAVAGMGDAVAAAAV